MASLGELAGAVTVVAMAFALHATPVRALNLTVGPQDGDVVGCDNAALQLAVDAVASKGGGTVYIKSGAYTMYNSLFLRSGVNVVGLGPAPVLNKAAAFGTRLAEDGAYGADRVAVVDASGLKKGMGVAFSDDLHNAGWYVAVRTIAAVEGSTIVLDEALELDYLVARNARVETVFPVICGKQVRGVRVENITADGNCGSNPPLDGCRAAAVYLWKSEDCVLDNVTARNFNGDGISFQASSRITVNRCRALRNTAQGIHPGAGSHHSQVTGCQITGNGQVGLFLCWRVQHSRFSDNVIADNGLDGISIGHQDTDNVFSANVVERNGRHGVLFRSESVPHGGSRNALQANTIRDNGQRQMGDGIRIEAATRDITIMGNTIEDTQRDGRVTQQNGIFLARGVDGIKTRGNVIRGNAGELIADQSQGASNSLQL